MLQPDQTFAHFRIIRLLGEGGMGAVYLAEDQKLKRQVALKVLLADYFEDPEHLARFEREARTAAQIQNRRVAHPLAVGLDSSSLTLAKTPQNHCNPPPNPPI